MRLLATVLAVLCLACTDDPARDLDPTLGDQAGSTTALAELLERPGSLQMPPVGVEQQADALVEVTVETFAAEVGFGAAVARRATAVANDFLLPVAEVDGLGELMAQLYDRDCCSDTQVQLTTGWGNRAIKGYLLASVADPVRAEVEAELADGAHYVHFQVYDASAEIDGIDLLVVRPFLATTAVAVRLHFQD
jgi:hypothetical protein